MSLPHALPLELGRALTSGRGASRSRLAWVALASIGWSGIAWLGFQLASASPPRAGFDLELLLLAGRGVAAGASPYDLSSLGGLAAQDLFYSYPPPLAQGLAVFAWLPMPVALAALGILSIAGLALVARLLGAQFAPGRAPADVVLPVLAVAPVIFPFAIAILFGNLDATFPFVYGLLALAAAGTGRGWLPPVAGTALACAAIAKLHPASLFVWFALRGGRRPQTVALAVLAAGVTILAASLLVGGLGPWRDYVEVLRAGAAADLVDARNVGPAAQLGLLLGGSEAIARLGQAAVSIMVIAFTALVARRVADPLSSLSLAAAASLVTLPVTWFHYPVALIPFAIAAALRASGNPRATLVFGLLVAAAVIGVAAILVPVAIWLAVACVLLAVRRSEPSMTPSTGRHARAAVPPVP